MITGKINCSKIDKTRLFKGEKGTYLDVVLIETPNDQHGNDYMIVQGVTKEEREKGIRGAILGNAKVRGGNRPQQSRPVPAQSAPNSPAQDGLDENIPF